MKIKRLVYTLAVGTLFFTACQDDETLDLRDYPSNQPEIFVQDATEEGDEPLVVKAAYQSDGSLKLASSLTRTYVYRFKASPKDMTVHFTPSCTNIPLDKVELSTSKVVLTAGETDAVVTVSLKDDDFSFAAPKLEAETYMLGVKATVEGYKVDPIPFESKLMIDKEPYQVFGLFEGQGDNAVKFVRTVAGGAVQETDPMSYTFKVKLDKKAMKDVTVRFSTEGLNDKYQSIVNVQPQTVVIPAGQLESDEVTWTIGNDFLAEDELPKLFQFQIKLTLESEDKTVQQYGSNVVAVTVDKKVQSVVIVDALPSAWKGIDMSNFSYSTKGSFMNKTTSYSESFNPRCLFDGGSTTSYLEAYSMFMPVSIIIDLHQAHAVKGLKIDYLSQWGRVAAASSMKLYTSSDGNDWQEEAALDEISLNTLVGESHVLSFPATLNTRFVKLEILKCKGNSYKICETTFYQ